MRSEESKYIKYKKGYAKQLHGDVIFDLSLHGIKVKSSYYWDFLTVSEFGIMTLKKGYACDGATCFPDMKRIMRSVFFHDAAYQLCRLGAIDPMYRKRIDKAMISLLKEDKVNPVIRGIIYSGIRIGGFKAVLKSSIRKIIYSPKKPI